MMADYFDASNSRHAYLRHCIERGNGIACILNSTEAKEAMGQAGFAVERVEDLADHEDPLPWWYFCSGSTEYAQTWTDWGRVARVTSIDGGCCTL